MDRVSPSTRSQNMSRIRSTGNMTTEKRLRAYLVRARLSGWHIHGSELAGRPDFIFPRQKVAIFVDGCFWHGCPRCGHTPKSNQRYWAAKLMRNRKRDRRVSRELRNIGWFVLRFWEHEILSAATAAVSQIKSCIYKH